MRARGLVVSAMGWGLFACRPGGGHPEHPDDPVNASPAGPVAVAAAPASPEPEPVPERAGIAYLHAQKIDLVRDAVPCPEDCARGEARTRCGVEADIRFHDLVAKGSHSDVRGVLERSPGISRCFDAVADASAKRLPSFRVPLDFVIGPDGKLQSREEPLHDPDPQLERMLECVGSWLEGLSFEGAGRPLPTRVRLHVAPAGTCAAPR